MNTIRESYSSYIYGYILGVIGYQDLGGAQLYDIKLGGAHSVKVIDIVNKNDDRSSNNLRLLSLLKKEKEMDLWLDNETIRFIDRWLRHAFTNVCPFFRSSHVKISQCTDHWRKLSFCPSDGITFKFFSLCQIPDPNTYRKSI